MAIYGKAKGKDFEPAPPGVHRAVCCDVVNLGLEMTKFGKKHRIRIVWQIEETREDGKPYLVMSSYGLTMHKKGRLRPDVESWFAKKFESDEAAENFDLEKLVGKNCQLNVIHNTQDGTTYANVTAVIPAARGVAPLLVTDYIRKCDREDWVEPVTEDDGHEDEYQAEEIPPPTDDDEVPF
jgi:hypothetical protein